MTPGQRREFDEQLPRFYKSFAAHAIQLVKRGRRRHGDLPGGDEAGDLLQLALFLLDSGKRRWPETEGFETVVKMTLLQLAGHRWRSPTAREVSLTQMIEGPLGTNREESESDSDVVDQMHGAQLIDLPAASDDEDDSNIGEIPGSSGSSDLYRLTAEQLYLLKEREEEIRRQMNTVLKDDVIGLRVVNSILGGCRTPRQIAKDLGITAIETYNAIRRLKSKLQQFVTDWRSP